jgi:hypothetical protein
MGTLHSTDYIIKLKRGLRAFVELTAASNSGVEAEPAYTTNDKNLWLHDGTKFNVVQQLKLAVCYNNDIICYNNEPVYIV